jgi:hypothetical protein
VWLRDGGNWSRALSGPNVVPDPLHPWRWRVRDMAKGKGRFVAVGGNLTTSAIDGTRAHGQVWTSSDGQHWQRLDDPALPFARSVLRHVQFFGDRFVAAGIVRDSDTTVHAAVWSSPDGQHWNRGPEGPFSAPTISDLGTLVAGGPGLILAATTENPTGAGDLVVWTSADGISWSAAITDPAGLGGAGEQMVFDACTRPGLVLLVGAERLGELDRAAAWSSADGVHWSRNPVPPTGRESDVDACVWTGREFLAGGYAGVGEGDAALWSSPDGRAWSLIPSPPSMGGPGRQAIYRLEQSGGRLVAFGFDYLGGGSELAVWTSADGRGWRRLALGPASVGSAAGEEVVSSMIDGGTVYVFGGRGEAAQIWRGRLPGGGG